eukprot:9792123-Lingulodinium_polyedra.AAC.1
MWAAAAPLRSAGVSFASSYSPPPAVTRLAVYRRRGLARTCQGYVCLGACAERVVCNAWQESVAAERRF